MKIRALSMLGYLALACSLLPITSAAADPVFKRQTLPGQLSVKSIDEQELPPAIKEAARERIRRVREHKVIPVSEQHLPDFAAIEAEFRAQGRPFSQIIAEKRVTFSPADVGATTLRGQAMPEALVSGIYTNQSWTGLSRMFHHPRLRYVILEETDLATTGGGAIFTREMINADVNGAPAMLVSQQGSPARSETSLGWFAKGILYSLRTPGVDDKSRDELLDIARLISK